jgi:hypothetical protein
MAAILDKVALLQYLGERPAQLTAQQTSTCSKAALLAIGDHIEGGQAPEWMVHINPNPEGEWEMVSIVAQHRMPGPKLRALYRAMKVQQEEALRRSAERAAGDACELQRLQEGRLAEDLKVAACMANARALMLQKKRLGMSTPAADAGGTRLLSKRAPLRMFSGSCVAPGVCCSIC